VTRTALVGISGFALAYLLAGTLQLPVLVYDPVARATTAARTLSGMQMRYYGDLLLATVAGLCAAALSHRLRPRLPLALPAGTALSLIAADLAYYLWRLLAAS
jgi:hypothetical protein